MGEYFLLLLLSFAMFIGSYISGSLPLVVSFTESKLRLVTIIGAGLLVGTALAVIIPEGVQSIYTAQQNDLAHNKFPSVESKLYNIGHSTDKHFSSKSIIKSSGTPQKRSLTDGRLAKDLPGALAPNGAAKLEEKAAEQLDKKPDESNAKRTKRNAELVNNPPSQQVSSESIKDHNEHAHEKEEAPHTHEAGGVVDVHRSVGIALVAGFVLMLLVDQVAQSRMSRVDSDSGMIVQQPRYKITATIGLVVHAAADGVALGAASGSSHNDVQFIVFVAIMLHKAPAAFGLVTFLLHEGLDKGKIRRHLLIFSLAAPLAALATFFFVTQGGSESLTSLHSTGILLLFSAGTFLYVATVHVLPEIASGGHAHGAGSGGNGLKLNELFALVLGTVLPTLLTVGHSH